MTNSSANLELWGAIFENDLDRAQAALEAGACPNKQRGTKSMLARALEREGPDMALMLLRAGADIRSAAHGTTCWDLCVRRGWTEAMEHFVRQGIDLNSATGGNHQFTAAGVAACNGNHAVLEWLDARGADVGLGELAKPTISIWMDRVLDSNTPEAWKTLRWLASRTHRAAWRGRIGDEIVMLERKHSGLGRKALAVLMTIPEWKEDENLLRVAHNAMLQANLVDWAGDLRQTHRIPMGPPTIQRLGPWTQTPLATLLMMAKKEAGRPRRMGKVLKAIRELVEYGADPNGEQNEMPLVFFATSQQCPPQAIETLLGLGANPFFPGPREVQAGRDEKDKTDQKVVLEGATLLHLAAREKCPEVVEHVGKRFPDLVSQKDPAGMPPLFRCVVPYLMWVGIEDKNPILPTLQAFRNLGASPTEETKHGNGLLLALLHARRRFNLNPPDLDESILFIHSWNPHTFDQVYEDGRDGWAVLEEPGFAPQGSKAHTLLRQRRMDQVLPKGRPGRESFRRI